MRGQDHQEGYARVRHVPIQVESRGNSRNNQRQSNRSDLGRHHQQGHYDEDNEYQQHRNHHQFPGTQQSNDHNSTSDKSTNTSSININYKPQPPQRQQQNRSAKNSTYQQQQDDDQSQSPSPQNFSQGMNRHGTEGESGANKTGRNLGSPDNSDKLVNSPEPIPLPPPEQHQQQPLQQQQTQPNSRQKEQLASPECDVRRSTTNQQNNNQPTHMDCSETTNVSHQQRNQADVDHKQSEQKSSSVLDKINSIKLELTNLLQEITTFNGTSAKSKDYRYLDEMLTRCMLNLDNVDCGNSKELRQIRKATIKLVDKATDILQRKLQINSDIHTLSESMSISS